MKNRLTFEQFVNERYASYLPNPNVKNEFTKVLMDLYKEAESKSQAGFLDNSLNDIARTVYYETLSQDIVEILNKDDFSKWTEGNLNFWVKKVSKKYKPQYFTNSIWSEFQYKSDDIENINYEINSTLSQIRDTRREMESQAGQMGDKWTDKEANEYGQILNDLEDKHKSLLKAKDYSSFKRDIEKESKNMSSEIIKKLKDL